MGSSTIQGGTFAAFLPADNEDLASPSTHAAIELINEDLSQLLRLPQQQFWQLILTDKSLHVCLDSFCRFRRRCYDEATESIQGSSHMLLQLSQRVFRVFWRMAHPDDLQQQQAHPAAAGSSSKQQQPLNPAKLAEQLYNNRIIDVPKMLDIAVLYGPGNSNLTGQLLQQLLLLQPKFAEDIMSLAEPLAGNLYEVAESVKRLADKHLKGKAAAVDTQQQLRELADAVKYFLDAFMTLQAFVTCLPAAAALLLHPDTHGALLLSLAVVHSSVLPLLHRISQQPSAADTPGLHPAKLLQLQHCLMSLTYHLIISAYCTSTGAAAAAEQREMFAGSTGNSSRGKAVGKVEQQQPQGLSAELQGQELMNLLMLLAHPADHVYADGDSGDLGSTKGGLLGAVNQHHHMDAAIAAAVDQGLISLDDAQFDYLLALVGGDRELLQQHKQQQQQHVANGSTNSSQGTTAAAGSSSSSSQLPADLPSKIASIKELLPDYGDGFLTAMLYHSNWDTERAINSLLEGSIPKQIQGLDPGLKTWVPPSSCSNGNRKHGSSAAAAAAVPGLSWTGLAKEAAAAAAAPAAVAVSLPSLEQAAAAAPKPQVDRRTGRVLGALPSQIRSATRNMAYEMQYEYDDEYDDSFDDLIGPGNDGVCDIEGEDSAAEQQQGSRKAAAPRANPARTAATADVYADEPGTSSSGGFRSAQQQQQGRQQKQGKLWVLDGKVYNYKKDGAVQVDGQAGAEKALSAAKQAAMEIHGLGPGGNVPSAVQDKQQKQKPNAVGGSAIDAGKLDNQGPRAGAQSAKTNSADAAAIDGAATASKEYPAGRGRGGMGPGRGRSGGAGSSAAADGTSSSGGRGRGRGSYSHKEQHKSGIANHHRKDRAMAKQAKGMF